MNRIQKQIISLMAKQSLKSERIHNIFIMITIILSISLLSVILLFGSADNTVTKKQLSHIQQAGYYNLNKQQLLSLKSNEDITYSVTVKTGTISHQKDFDIIPYYVSEMSDKIKIGELESGSLPEQMNEVAVSTGMLKKLNLDPSVGTEVDITFHDGTTENFIVSGTLKGNNNTKQFAVFFSEEYAENGSQLKDIPYELYAKFHEAEQMSKDECKKMIYHTGETAGIDRKYINPTKSFLDTLTPDSQMIMIEVLIGGVILLACILVIYGIFYISVIGRIHQFGQLRTIGMTRKQLKKFVLQEGRNLFIRSAPVGLLIGGFAGYIINPAGWKWLNTLWISIIVFTVIYMITMISIKKPAKIASSVSPMEALRYMPQNYMKQSESIYECRNLTSAGMGIINFSKNRKKAVSTLLSLGLGGILFITSATYISSFDKENYARQGDFKEAEFVIGISSGAISLDENGMSGIQNNNPLNTDFIQQINMIDGIKSVTEVKHFGIKFDFPEHDEYGNDDTVLPISDEKVKEIDKYLDEGTADYDKLMSGDYVLAGGNDIAEEIYGWKFSVGDKLIFHYYNGEKTEEKQVEVIGILNNNFNLDNNLEGWFVLPENVINDWISYNNLNSRLLISVNPEKESEISGQLESLVSEHSQLDMEVLQDREQQYEDMANKLFSIISGLAIFIMMFSILSMINMMINNIAVRKKEFAMLEAIGMTKKQICKMILSESILISGITLFTTLTIGTFCGYILSTMLYNNGAFYMQFRFPTAFSAAYIALLIIVPFIITTVCMYKFSKEPLTERFR